MPIPESETGPECAVLSIYRTENAAVLADLLEPLPADTSIRLWGLDGTDERLAAHTVGSGPGGRMELLNRLVGSLGEPRPELMVVTDDDVRFVVGDLTRLIAVGCALRFDVFQPAHARRSTTAFTFTRKRPLTVARRTTFVEQGPMLVISRDAQQRLLPFPEDLVMGWGVEVRWQTQAPDLRWGIIDAVAIHHGRRNRRYDYRAEQERLIAELAAAGHDDLTDIQLEVRRYGLFRGWRDGRRASQPDHGAPTDRPQPRWDEE